MSPVVPGEAATGRAAARGGPGHDVERAMAQSLSWC
jgi:hypothetical protein